MSAAAAATAGPASPVKAKDWLVSGLLHAGAVIAFWQFAMHGGPSPSDLRRLELPIRWAADPVAPASSAPMPAVTPAPAPAAPSRERAATKPSRPLPQPAPKLEAVATAPVSPVPTPQSVAAAPAGADSLPVQSPTVAAGAAVVDEASAAAPGGDAAPAAPARPVAPDPVARHRWRHDLEQLMLEHKRYPLQARRMRQQGVVTVQALFSADGELVRCEVADSSGFRILDEAALQLVRTAAGLLRARQLPGALAELRIPIAYELTGS